MLASDARSAQAKQMATLPGVPESGWELTNACASKLAIQQCAGTPHGIGVKHGRRDALRVATWRRILASIDAHPQSLTVHQSPRPRAAKLVFGENRRISGATLSASASCRAALGALPPRS
jgi:hypothetical protein